MQAAATINPHETINSLITVCLDAEREMWVLVSQFCKNHNHLSYIIIVLSCLSFTQALERPFHKNGTFCIDRKELHMMLYTLDRLIQSLMYRSMCLCDGRCIFLPKLGADSCCAALYAQRYTIRSNPHPDNILAWRRCTNPHPGKIILNIVIPNINFHSVL